MVASVNGLIPTVGVQVKGALDQLPLMLLVLLRQRKFAKVLIWQILVSEKEQAVGVRNLMEMISQLVRDMVASRLAEFVLFQDNQHQHQPQPQPHNLIPKINVMELQMDALAIG